MTGLQEKRVAVAKDALAQVECGRFVPDYCYCVWRQEKCYGCAIGALLLGAIDCQWAKRSEAIVAFDVHDGLESLWSSGELNIIEDTHEGSYEWAKRYGDRRGRMTAILQNIIRNNGTFIPSDLRPISPEAPTINSLDFKNVTACISDLRREAERV